MSSSSSAFATPLAEPAGRHWSDRAGGGVVRVGQWLRRGSDVMLQAAMLALLLLSPSTYAESRARRAFVLRAYLAVTSGLLAFLLLSSCMSGVLVRMVAGFAQDYGLSQFALEGIVRVLLLELIPLLAALFVLVEFALPAAAALGPRRSPEDLSGAPAQRALRTVALRRAALPHALAGIVALLALSALASWIALVLGYLTLYGSTPWALQGFARVLGKVFEPAVATILSLKLCAFGASVALLPIAAVLAQPPGTRADSSDFTLTILIRTGALLLLIELLSLLGSYA